MHVCSLIIFTISSQCFAQTDSSLKKTLNISGYGDFYYAHYFGHSYKDKKVEYLYNFNLNRIPTANLVLLKAALKTGKARANIAGQMGSYVYANYIDDPWWLKFISEANIGVALNNKNNLWLDAGIFPSYIGFESPVAINNWTLTRSLLAENSPYYLSGAKISYQDKHKSAALFLLNGWQNIPVYKKSKFPALGAQFTFTEEKKFTLNWSSYFGTKLPDEFNGIWLFNNFYGIFQLNNKLGLTIGFDEGTEFFGEELLSAWFSPVVITQYKINEHFRTAVRAEYYYDAKNIIVTSDNYDFKTAGASLNFDWFPYKNFACRVEGRWLHSDYPVFNNNGRSSREKIFIVGSLALKID